MSQTVLGSAELDRTRAEADEAMWLVTGDPRLSVVGRRLRSSPLDELPRRELTDEAAVLRGLGCQVVAAIVEDGGGIAHRLRSTGPRPSDPLPVEEATP